MAYNGLFRLYPVPNSSIDGFIDNGSTVVRKSVLNLLNTKKGSRIYDPDYGTDLYKLIHELNIQRTRNIAKTEITNAITKYEPRAVVNSVDAYPGMGDKAGEVVITIDISYIEFGLSETLEIKLAGDQEWISKEGKAPDPIRDWFSARL